MITEVEVIYTTVQLTPKRKMVDLNWLSIAVLNGLNRSKDPRRPLGAALVSADGRMVSLGYNGFPAGVEETVDMWEPPIKYSLVMHAELNAILNAPFDTNASTLYCPLRPCSRCLGAVINARVYRVVWYGNDEQYSQDDVWASDLMLNHLQHTIYGKDPTATDIRWMYGVNAVGVREE